MSWITPSFDDVDIPSSSSRVKKSTTLRRSASSPIRSSFKKQQTDAKTNTKTPQLSKELIAILMETDLSSIIEEELDSISEPQKTVSAVKRLQEPQNKQELPWTELYKPSDTSQLIVNQSKIKEIQSWMEQSISKDKADKILLLSGPSGCGKTLSIQLIAKQLSLDVCEFTLHASEKSYDHMLTDENTNFFSQECESQFSQFYKFVLGTNSSFDSVNLSNPSNKLKRLLIVKDLGNTFASQANKYQEFLIRYLTTVKNCVPIVFIFTCEQGSSEIKERLFPKNLQEKLGVKCLELNSIPKSVMSRFLNTIMNGQLSKNYLDHLVASADGDVRNAINMLELSFRHISNHSELPNKQKKMIGMSLDQMCGSSLNMIGGKDTAPIFFHFLGKILYCKRIPLKSFNGSVEQLPCHLSAQQRFPLKENLESLMDSMCDGAENMSLFVHQNYNHFIGDDLKSAALCSSWLSLVDEKFSCKESWNADHLTEYAKLLCMRGIMFNLPSSLRANFEKHSPLIEVKKRFLSFEKPQFFDRLKKEKEIHNLLQHLTAMEVDLQNLHCPNELILDILPSQYAMKQYKGLLFAQKFPSIYGQVKTLNNLPSNNPTSVSIFSDFYEEDIVIDDSD